jgi:O-acetyl-ADP-ribose deacetylase (regulator of RNase III)
MASDTIVTVADKSALIKVKGNLLDMADAGDFDYIIHGCNCFNAMGGGIARQIASQYPTAQDADDATKRGAYMKLGNFTFANVGKFTIINAYTQYNTSIQGEDVFEYDAFKLVLKKILREFGGKNYGLPLIGMGLAGGDKKIIMPIIGSWAGKVAALGGSVTLVEFQP